MPLTSFAIHRLSFNLLFAVFWVIERTLLMTPQKCIGCMMRRRDRRWDSEVRPVRCSTSSFRTRSYHLIPNNCLRHFWWKASRVLTSADSKVQVSAAYSNTDKTSVWYIRSLVSSVRRLSLHISFRDIMTAQLRPILHRLHCPLKST